MELVCFFGVVAGACGNWGGGFVVRGVVVSSVSQGVILSSQSVIGSLVAKVGLVGYPAGSVVERRWELGAN